jgi:hypothetical protein
MQKDKLGNVSPTIGNTVLPAVHLIYALSSMPKYGETEGICRITGIHGKGLDFNKWIKPTFTDHASLLPGNIISNEALFCFDEASNEIMNKVGKDKPQRFRTYSHIIHDNKWHCLTKANKKEIFEMICSGAKLVCLTDTGQKHILFKHKIGMWQLDELFIYPDIEYLQFLHSTMQNLLHAGFTQTSIINGDYNLNFIAKNGFEVWKENEDKLKEHRGKPMFDFAAWMLFLIK